MFRRADLLDIGGWNEGVALNEGWELNARYRASGRVVWVVGALSSAYIPRGSFRLLARQHFYFGRVKGMWWVRVMRPSPRQGLLIVGPVVGLVGAIRRRCDVIIAMVTTSQPYELRSPKHLQQAA